MKTKLMILFALASVMLTFTGPGICAVLANVNIDTSAKAESILDSPIYGTGGADVAMTWNQILSNPATDISLLDPTGAVATVDFTCNAGSLNTWCIPGFTLLTSAVSSPSGQAIGPNPVDGAIGLSSNTDLSWTAGVASVSHDVIVKKIF